MRGVKFLMLAAVAGSCCAAVAPKAEAQVSINIGVAPVCPYGYYDAAPYSCAPYGYYGPEWFTSGIFVGADPWFHGPEHFYGHVNNRYHPGYGYRGGYPARGEAPRQGWNGHVEHFKGNEFRDGRGHTKR